ncbi:DNA (cytosine-5-)-methyltransferase [Labrys sp. ZIDIC5]|uniref:DNA cytosine methyltransferase n=1 Tax=Labrys sedimenti TaxID=3106036 RepID=UPI002ACB00AF|nr:DNA (cytosine-5-)-methyltransferase [Labrys sp. ZIDIC5]MDZ5448922.1 DNA (cytosine-5-)-methyltransferase [Labrys sp. ZIDIC5]
MTPDLTHPDLEKKDAELRALAKGQPATKFRVLDLFSGIGGFSLGLERTGGFETVAFCEIEPFPRKVLKKHWPNVPCYEDVRTLTAERLAADGISVDVICGGFPCQDVSNAGPRLGLAGERSGLWSEITRLVSAIRPQFVIVENVSALLGRGLHRVLGDLAEIGFDAEWHCIPASAFGAPHARDRVWIIAYPDQEHAQRQFGGSDGSKERKEPASRPTGLLHRTGRLPSWPVEPVVGRVGHGFSNRMDRAAALGNAVVPQIPELIGRAILEARPHP